jgi:hypothetical protein
MEASVDQGLHLVKPADLHLQLSLYRRSSCARDYPACAHTLLSGCVLKRGERRALVLGQLGGPGATVCMTVSHFCKSVFKADTAKLLDMTDTISKSRPRVKDHSSMRIALSSSPVPFGSRRTDTSVELRFLRTAASTERIKMSEL